MYSCYVFITNILSFLDDPPVIAILFVYPHNLRISLFWFVVVLASSHNPPLPNIFKIHSQRWMKSYLAKGGSSTQTPKIRNFVKLFSSYID